MNKYVWTLGIVSGIIEGIQKLIADIIHAFHCLWDGTFSSLHLGLIKLSMFIDCLFMYVSSFFIKLFNVMASINLFKDNSIYNELAKKVYILMAVVMLFVLAYNLIYHVIDPDSKNTKFGTPGQTAKKIVVALIGLLVAPTAFSFLADVQTAIINYGTIGRIILDNDSGSSFSVEHAADSAIAQIYKAFVYPSSDNDGATWGVGSEKDADLFKDSTVVNFIESCGACEKKDIFPAAKHYGDPGSSCDKNYIMSGEKYSQAFDKAVENSDFLSLPGKLAPNVLVNDKMGALKAQTEGSWKSTYYNNNGLTYIPGIPILVFIYLCYTVFLFLFDLALRMFNLFFLQLMAPIAFGMYLLPDPKDKVFKTWLSSFFKTYALVFVKQAFLYLMVFIMAKIVDPQNGVIKMILDGIASNEALSKMGWFARLFVIVIIICGLFRFINGLPKFLKDSLGVDLNAMGKSSAKAIFDDVKGGFSKTKKTLTAPYNATKRGIGHAAGAYGGARYGLHKMKTGMSGAKTASGKARGFLSGLSAMKSGIGAGMKEGNAAAGVRAGQKAYEAKRQARAKEKAEWKNMLTGVKHSLENMKISTDGFSDKIRIIIENNDANKAQVAGVIQKNMDNAQLARIASDKSGKVASLKKFDSGVDFDRSKIDAEVAQREAAISSQISSAEASEKSNFGVSSVVSDGSGNGLFFKTAVAKSEFMSDVEAQKNIARQNGTLTPDVERQIYHDTMSRYQQDGRISANYHPSETVQALYEKQKRVADARKLMNADNAGNRMLFTDGAVKSQFEQKVLSKFQAASDAEFATSGQPQDEEHRKAYFQQYLNQHRDEVTTESSRLAADYMAAGLMISSDTTIGAREAYAQDLAHTSYEDLSDEQRALMTREEFYAHVSSAQTQAAIFKEDATEVILQHATEHPDEIASIGLNSKDQQVLVHAAEAQRDNSEMVESLILSRDMESVNQALSDNGFDQSLLYDFGTADDLKRNPDKFRGHEGDLVNGFVKTVKNIETNNIAAAQEEKKYQAMSGNSGGSNGSK